MKIKKIWDFILNIFSIIGGIIISIFAIIKINNITKIKQQNWKSIQGKPDYVEIYADGKWKEVKLPQDKNGKQIFDKEIKTIGISKKGNINVKIKTGVTDRRSNSSSNNTSPPMGL